MNNTLTTRPPPLEKLLLDADLDPRVEPLLRALGFRTQSVSRIKVDVTDDAAIVRWGRPRGYTVVCHDRHKDFPTKLKLYPEIVLYGGRVISVSSDKERNPYTTVGQLLARRQEWLAWFTEHEHGAVFIHATGMNTFDRNRLARLAPNVMNLDDTIDGQAKRVRSRKAPAGRKRPTKKRAGRELL